MAIFMIVKMVVLPLNGHLYCTDDDFNGNLYDHDERAGDTHSPFNFQVSFELKYCM